MFQKIYSECEQDKLLHIIFNNIEGIKTRVNLSEDKEFLQVMALRENRGKTFNAHYHVFKKLPILPITQECLVIIKGSVECFLYDTDNKLIANSRISAGDCVITFYGGHKYKILEDDTLFYEFKNGPYYGQLDDKVWIT